MAHDSKSGDKLKVTLAPLIVVIILLYSLFGYLFPNSIQAPVITGVCVLLIGKSFFGGDIVKLKHRWVIYLLICFILFLLVTSSNSENPRCFWMAITTGAILSIGIFLSVQKSWVDSFLRYLLLFALVHALFTIFASIYPGVFSVTILPLLPEEVGKESARFLAMRLYAGITDQIGRNSLYLSFGVAVLVSKRVCQKSRTKILNIIICIMVLALLLTGKKGPLLSNILATTVTMALYAKSQGKSALSKVLVSILAATLIIVLLIIVVPEAAAPFLRFAERAEAGDLTTGRIDRYIVAVDLFSQKPLLGWGMDYFALAYGTGVHNVFLQLLCETGILGAVLFVSLLVANLVVIVRAVKLNRMAHIRNYDWPLLFSLYLQIFYCSYCMTGNPLSDRDILVIYMIATAIPYAITIPRRTEVRSWNRPIAATNRP